MFLPHELVPRDVPKDKMPLTVFRKCVRAMKDADIIVANINVYGKDTSWEIGYCYGLGKIVMGFTKNRSYKHDFMVNQSVIITTSEDELVNILKKHIEEKKT